MWITCTYLQIIQIVLLLVLGLMLLIILPSAGEQVTIDQQTDERPTESSASCVLHACTLGGVCAGVVNARGLFIFIGCVYLLAVLLHIWFFTIVLACYRYLHDKFAAATSLPTAYE